MVTSAEVADFIKTLNLRWFTLRRCTTAYNQFGNIYEWRIQNKWYPIHRDHMLFPKMTPAVAEFVQKLFTWLNEGNEVQVLADYHTRHATGNLLIVPDLEPQENGVRPASVHLDPSKNTTLLTKSSSVLTRLQTQHDRLIHAAQQCLETGP